jgi:hypothetical protein
MKLSLTKSLTFLLFGLILHPMLALGPCGKADDLPNRCAGMFITNGYYMRSGDGVNGCTEVCAGLLRRFWLNLRGWKCGRRVCAEVNGLTWYWNPKKCGEGCTAVCNAFGLIPEDETKWSQAQDTQAECENLADAFGFTKVSLTSTNPTACLEDTHGDHTNPKEGLLGDTINCSSNTGCPGNHKTNAFDSDGCDSTDGTSVRSICPCVTVT